MSKHRAERKFDLGLPMIILLLAVLFALFVGLVGTQFGWRLPAWGYESLSVGYGRGHG